MLHLSNIHMGEAHIIQPYILSQTHRDVRRNICIYLSTHTHTHTKLRDFGYGVRARGQNKLFILV